MHNCAQLTNAKLQAKIQDLSFLLMQYKDDFGIMECPFKDKCQKISQHKSLIASINDSIFINCPCYQQKYMCSNDINSKTVNSSIFLSTSHETNKIRIKFDLPQCKCYHVSAQNYTYPTCALPYTKDIKLQQATSKNGHFLFPQYLSAPHSLSTSFDALFLYLSISFFYLSQAH